MKRISVSTLETFRRVVDNVSDYDTEEKLIDSIKGVFVETPAMLTGTLLHKVVQGDCHYLEGQLIVKHEGKNYAFLTDQIKDVIDMSLLHKGAIFEVPVSKIWEIGNTDIMISARVDAMTGDTIHDYKFTSRADINKYIHSIQSDIYMDILEIDNFEYNIFKIRGVNDAMDTTKVQATALEPLKLYQRKDSPTEIHRLLSDFVEYVRAKELWDYLKEAEEYQTTKF